MTNLTVADPTDGDVATSRRALTLERKSLRNRLRHAEIARDRATDRLATIRARLAVVESALADLDGRR